MTASRRQGYSTSPEMIGTFVFTCFLVCFFLVSDSVRTRDSYGSVCIIYPLSIAFTSLIWMSWGTVLPRDAAFIWGKSPLEIG